MELKEGYNMTEVGLIPVDWSCVYLEDCLIAKPMYGIAAAANSYNSNLPTYLRITDITEDGKYNKANQASINHPLAESYYLEEGDIVFARTGASVGKTYLYDNNDGKLVFAGFLIRIRPNIKDLYPAFFSYYSHTQSYWRWVLSNSMRSGQPGINGNECKRLPIPLPSQPEQVAISTALSDMDELITQTEKLIEKKKAIKQGMMQQLLSPYDTEGKLKEGWHEKTLFEIADEKKELFNDGDWIESEHIATSGIRLVQTGNIGTGRFIEKEEKKYIYEASFKKLRCKALKSRDILICRLAEPAGRACLLHDIGDEVMVTSVDITIFRPRKEVVNRVFFINLLSTPLWFSKIAERVGGTTHKRISRSSLGKIGIMIPAIEVQNNIAEFLSVIDKELIQLETKADKLQKLKQSMMQSLLTGKIRIYKPNYEPATQV